MSDLSLFVVGKNWESSILYSKKRQNWFLVRQTKLKREDVAFRFFEVSFFFFVRERGRADFAFFFEEDSYLALKWFQKTLHIWHAHARDSWGLVVVSGVGVWLEREKKERWRRKAFVLEFWSLAAGVVSHPSRRRIYCEFCVSMGTSSRGLVWRTGRARNSISLARNAIIWPKFNLKFTRSRTRSLRLKVAARPAALVSISKWKLIS